MGNTIKISVRNKIAAADGTLYVCGNSDFVLKFDFDAEWGEFTTKTARFVFSEEYLDVVFQDNVCPVPVLSNIHRFYVGVYAGDLRTTTPATVGAQRSILCGSEAPATPHPDVYAQMVALFNAGLDESRENANTALAAQEAAQASAVDAATSAGVAARQAADAETLAKQAGASAEATAKSEQNAKASEEAAAQSEQNAREIAEAAAPIVELAEINGGTQMNITDVNGKHTFDVLDGHSVYYCDEVSPNVPLPGVVFSFPLSAFVLNGRTMIAGDLAVTKDGYFWEISNPNRTDGKVSLLCRFSLRGDKDDPGVKGDTPIKGTDYWTETDKQEIVDEVLTDVQESDNFLKTSVYDPQNKKSDVFAYADNAANSIYNSLNTSKLEKTTYEYNKQLALGSTGKVCIGKFPCYDSNISVEIKSTTNTAYNGTLVIYTQNINTNRGGTFGAVVFGDDANTLTDLIRIEYLKGSNVFSVYANLPPWSKNLLHIQCVALKSAPTDIATSVDAIPETADLIPVNAFKTNVAKAVSDAMADYSGGGGSGGVSSWNDLTDKPETLAYVEDGGTVEILPETTVAFEGGEGMVEAVIPLTVGETYTVKWNGTEYTCVAQDASAIGGSGCVGLGNGTEMGLNGNGEPFIVATLPSDGITATMALDGSTEAVVSVKQEQVVVHKLDNRCLDLAWLPTMVEGGYTNVVFEDTIKFMSGFTSKNFGIPLVEGENYKIYWNGAEYELTARKVEADGYYTIWMGNGSLIVHDGIPPVDTGEPFLIVTGGEVGGEPIMTSFTKNTATAEEISVQIVGADYVPNKLPSDFLPDDATELYLTSPNGTVFKITVSDDGVLSAAEVTE